MYQLRPHLLFLVLVLAPLAGHSADNLGKEFDGATNKLRAEVESADRIVVRTCGVVPEEKAVSHVIMEIVGKKEVAAFLKPFGLFGKLSGAAGCDCNGDPTFEIYKDNRLVATLALKHGLSLSWPGAWPHEMFPPSQEAIDNLFLIMANKGYPVYMHQKQILVQVISGIQGSPNR